MRALALLAALFAVPDGALADDLPAIVRHNARPLSEPDLLAIGVVLVAVMAILLFRRLSGGRR